MSASLVAASLRGRTMASHGCGAAGARALATGDWADLVAGLAGSMYGAGLAPSANRAVVRGHCSEVVVWNLRVLAGWVPTGSLAMLRTLVGEFEIDNIEVHLRHLESGSAPPPLELGALAVAWPRVQSCSTPDEVRDVLRFSSWGARPACSRRATRRTCTPVLNHGGQGIA